jgi:hypothetical protein
VGDAVGSGEGDGDTAGDGGNVGVGLGETVGVADGMGLGGCAQPDGTSTRNAATARVIAIPQTTSFLMPLAAVVVPSVQVLCGFSPPT